MKVIEKGRFVTIKSKDFKVILCDVGASVYDIWFCKKHMVMTTFSKNKWADDIHTYNGKTAGRICGRVPGGDLVFQEKHYPMVLNDGKNSLHGGTYGISTRTFSRKIEQKDDGVVVAFNYLSKDGEEGYPGNVDITVTYTVKPDASVLIEFDSKADMDTPIDLTNHLYYNLGASKDATGHFLKGNVDGCFFARGDTTIDIKKLMKFKKVDLHDGCFFKDLVAEDCFQDFFQKGSDHCYKWDGKEPNYLDVTNGKFKMHMTSDYDCFQVYSENWFKKGVLLNNWRFDKQYQALAIEPQDTPVDFDGMISPKGKVKHKWMRIEFYKE